MKYNPDNSRDRRNLARALLSLFERALFVEVFIPGVKERVFARPVPDSKMRVLVYSTIEGDSCRGVGKDAIRVCAIYQTDNGPNRGIATADKRVNRTGEITSITERVIDRMRQCWKATKTVERCHCGAPKFKSKAGNMVCSDLCWKKSNHTHAYYQDAAFKAHADEFAAQLGYGTVLACPKDDRGLLIEMYHTHLIKPPTPWWKKS